MKRKQISEIPFSLPVEIYELTVGSSLFDSSCSPEAKVFFINKDDGYYLKVNSAENLSTEALMTDYFYKKGLGTELIFYKEYGGHDFMLTRRAKGEDCTHKSYLENPKRLCDTLALYLRELHETDYSGCPIQNRNSTYLSLCEKNYKSGIYDPTLFGDKISHGSADDAYKILHDGRNQFKCDVLLHGDYCLPNILLDNWKMSAFIDVGNGGVGDRHIDLFWGQWTLWFNLKTDKYCERFLDAYGRDKISPEMLEVISAAEMFG